MTARNRHAAPTTAIPCHGAVFGVTNKDMAHSQPPAASSTVWWCMPRGTFEMRFGHWRIHYKAVASTTHSRGCTAGGIHCHTPLPAELCLPQKALAVAASCTLQQPGSDNLATSCAANRHSCQITAICSTHTNSYLPYACPPSPSPTTTCDCPPIRPTYTLRGPATALSIPTAAVTARAAVVRISSAHGPTWSVKHLNQTLLLCGAAWATVTG